MEYNRELPSLEEDVDKIVNEYKNEKTASTRSSAPNLLKRKIKQIFSKAKLAKSTSAIKNATKIGEVKFEKCTSYAMKQSASESESQYKECHQQPSKHCPQCITKAKAPNN